MATVPPFFVGHTGGGVRFLFSMAVCLSGVCAP
ncbi:unnamed protein product [Ectocarpus sp. CCAP 1310/34]|nr:unnamed protein product [Ectocarpus sp. CCAP 1310/34]